ncbi:MAG: hypothetical protein KC418_21565 [Anaerolineales bacterium]|nr:hypothetical protein [Anaerolineales bacterium]MCB8952057.1 hypothetical protein [Ardenticatenales bacterium]
MSSLKKPGFSTVRRKLPEWFMCKNPVFGLFSEESRMSKQKSKRPKGKKKREAKRRPERPLLTIWPIESDVPTNDLFTYRRLDDPAALEWILEDFIYELESGYFLQWEAVVSQEQNLPLTKKQQEALAGLLHFGDEPDERILYIDEIPRPKEPWYAIAGKLASLMVKHPFHTSEIMYGIYDEEGWPMLVSVISKHGQHLSLPASVKSPLDIFPSDLQHRLWLQTCFASLSGLGQDEILTLANEEQQDRVKWFIRDLRKHKDTVRYLNLTLDSLLMHVILPPEDEVLFVPMMIEQLSLPSPQTPLVDYL